MSGEVTTKAYWDNYWGAGKPRYPNYDKSGGQFYSYDLLMSACIARTRERLRRRDLALLDCGCGEGLILRFVHEQYPGVSVTGIEYSDAIEKARVMGQELGYDFRLVRCNLLEAPDPALVGAFDVVVSVGLIEHFEDHAAMLARLNRFVAPGGCLITIIPNFSGLFNFLWKLYDTENYRHHVPISESQLVESHGALGLEDVSFYTLGTPTVPGPHAETNVALRLIRWLTVQVNGRILRRIWPLQPGLATRYAMTPVVACVGWQPFRG